ncbi:MAG TPA: MarR family transcriptional regulator [Ignavibacteria bacterium]
MKLEKEIMQERFKSEHQKMVVNLLFTGSWIGFQQLQILKPFGLTIQQYNILRILKGQYPNPATVNLLIERMLDKTSNASRIADRLVHKKFITRKTCPEDRRSVDVVIRKEGLELLEKIEAKEKELENKFNSLTNSEMKSLNNLLDKLRG